MDIGVLSIFSRRYYSIENSLIHYIYNDEANTFCEVDDKYDTILEWDYDAFDSLANYLLTEAFVDEDSAGAIAEMALDVFSSWDGWNRQVLYHRIKETEEDFRSLKECKAEYNKEDTEA